MGPPNTPYPASTFDDQSGKNSGDESDGYDQVQDHPLSRTALSFVHGGLSPTYSNLAPFPSRINEFIEKNRLLIRLIHTRPSTTDEEEELYDANGLFGIGDIRKNKFAMKLTRMIMGHTPHFQILVTGGSSSRFLPRLIMTCEGISHAYGGALSALSIEYSLVPVPRGRVEKWVEKEVVRALYADSWDVMANDVREIEEDLLGDEFQKKGVAAYD
ncbi:hypothetical protein F5887DRAFT_918068 [Amanita rubescens]|nr:hypothetical protein F5887DRAFT_918068 [Amanita rubescens]